MKKWTYLIAAGLLAGATPVFTGCIDNDEPEGISILRGAKAELLKAKAAVEAAKVAQVQAEAALLQAKAAVEEANAVKIQAEAEKIKAEAAIAQAKADYINAKTDEAKANAQAIIEENQRIQKEWEEKAAQRAAEAEAAIKKAEYDALTAKANYEMVLATLAGVKDSKLTGYKTALTEATTAYYDALDDLVEAQRKLNDYQAKFDEIEEYKDLNTRELQKQLKLAEAAYAGAEAALEAAKTELEEFQANNKTQHSLYDKLDEVNKKREALDKEIIELKIKAGEQIAEFLSSGRMAKVSELRESIYDLRSEEQTLAAVEFDYGDGSGYPSYINKGIEEFLEESVYTYNEEGNYVSYIEALTAKLKEFRSWTRDENDNAWTAERIVKLEGDQAAIKKRIDENLLPAWKEAVKAYNTNKYNEADPTAISGYDALLKEITDVFNPEVDAYNAAKKAAADADTEQEDWEKYNEIAAAADDVYTKAQTAANEKADAALDPATLNATVTAKKAALQKTMTDAQATLDAAEKSLNEYTGTDQTTLAALTKAVENAQKALQTATDNYLAYDEAAEIAAIEKTRNDEIATAYKTYQDALQAANDTYIAVWNSPNGTKYLNLVALQTAAQEAGEKMQKAAESTVDKAVKYNEAISELMPIDYNDIYYAANGAYDIESGYMVSQKLDIKVLLILDKAALTQVVINRSNALYGTGAYSGENAYGDFTARLIELTEADIKELILNFDEDEAKNLHEYLLDCDAFGAWGEYFKYAEQIRLAKSWLNNSELINAKIAEAETALNTATKTFEDLEGSIQAKQDEYTLAYETLIADIETLQEPVENKQNEYAPLNVLYRTYNQAIQDYIAAGESVWSAETLENYINLILKPAVQSAENELFNAETELMQAQKNLEDWNSGNLTTLETYKRQVEDAQNKVDRKKEALDKAQAALESMIAQLSAE